MNRHSPHSTSTVMKSEMKVREQLPKHYKEIKLDKYLISSSQSAVVSICLRHSLHSTSPVTESEMKVQKQLLKH